MKKSILLLVITLISQLSFACSCYYNESNFYKNISKESALCMAVFDSLSHDTTDWGYPRQIAHFKLIDPINSFKTVVGSEFLVTGQDGFSCAQNMEVFSKGDTSFLALSGSGSLTSLVDTFSLMSCGSKYLKIKNGQSRGLTISEIKAKINSVVEHLDLACVCSPFSPYNFFDNVSKKTSNYLAVFQSFDYNHSEKGLRAQTGYFTLVNASENKESIVIIGEDGINCGERIDLFTPGDTMFLALSEGFYRSFVKDTFYLVGGECGQHFLKIKNGYYNSLSIQDIKEKIDFVTGVKKEQAIHIDIFPNPTNEIVQITSKNSSIKSIEVYGLSGNTVLYLDHVNEYVYELSLSEIESGVYFLKVNSEKGIVQKKIIKN